MIESDVVEAVLGLGPNLFYNSPMEACVVICRSVKPKERKNKVLFINAVDQVTRQQAQSFLTAEHIAKIAGVYESFSEEAGFTAIATKEQILANGGDLNIVKYVKRDRDEAEARSLSEVLTEWRTSSTQLRATATELFEVLDARA
jgi:type I restriction enzyme M protein